MMPRVGITITLKSDAILKITFFLNRYQLKTLLVPSSQGF